MPRKSTKQTTENYSKVLPTRLRGLMRETGSTQQDVADSIGVTRQSVGYYCNGDSAPDWEIIVKLAKCFNVSADYLLGLTDVKSVDADARVACEYTGLSYNALESLKKAQDMVEKHNAKCNINTNCLEKFVCCIEPLLPELLCQETECARIDMILETLNGDDPIIRNNPDYLNKIYNSLLRDRIGITGLKYSTSEIFSRLYDLITPYSATKLLIESTLQRLDSDKSFEGGES